MLSPQLRQKVHNLWSLFWSAGISNPLSAIEQITYLLFIRQLENLDRDRVRDGKTSIFSSRNEAHVLGAQVMADEFPKLDSEKCRWSYIKQNPSFELLNGTVFPWLRGLEKWLAEERVRQSNKLIAQGKLEEAARLKALDRLEAVTDRLNDAYFILDTNKTDTRSEE